MIINFMLFYARSARHNFSFVAVHILTMKLKSARRNAPISGSRLLRYLANYTVSQGAPDRLSYSQMTINLAPYQTHLRNLRKNVSRLCGIN